MRGHVYKRGSTWTYVHDADRTLSGQRRQRTRGGFPTRREAQAALAADLAKYAGGEAPEPTKITVAQYLQDEWLPSLHDLRPNTQLSYETLTRLHVIPYIGS